MGVCLWMGGVENKRHEDEERVHGRRTRNSSRNRPDARPSLTFSDPRVAGFFCSFARREKKRWAFVGRSEQQISFPLCFAFSSSGFGVCWITHVIRTSDAGRICGYRGHAFVASSTILSDAKTVDGVVSSSEHSMRLHTQPALPVLFFLFLFCKYLSISFFYAIAQTKRAPARSGTATFGCWSLRLTGCTIVT